MKPSTKTLKHILISTLVIASFTFATGAHAQGTCGKGKIEEILEGGWGHDELMIKLSSTAGSSALWEDVYVRYSATALSAERLRGIRATAYLAMAGDKTVEAYTHTADCQAATQLAIFK